MFSLITPVHSSLLLYAINDDDDDRKLGLVSHLFTLYRNLDVDVDG